MIFEDGNANWLGGLNYESAFEFIKNKFLSLNKHTKKRQLYTHATCAVCIILVLLIIFLD